ncbi:MAG: helix-turn-helix domain-containing protein [Candidatus Neomarinimicrobiota bacterium]|nr:helix-turn-helix domain-containing protein [Candidatus Neomarinimicrobiota bacterium]
MAQFYKELRELRLSKEINLEELENRTKINAKYLEAIEEGNFDILPIPYLRLFLRAYAIEIGGDSERALEQLDSFIGNTKPKMIPLQQNEDTMEDTSNSEKISLSILFSKSNLKLRKDIIKVGVLSVFFIFSIVIIKKIFSNEIDYSNNSSEKKVIRKMELITEEKLITNYTEDKFIEESLSIEPPFFLTLLAGSDIGITIVQDTLKPYIKYLNPGTELNLEGFISKAELIFTNTEKLRVRLNGIELNPIKNYSHPLRLLIKSSPPSFTARLYKPIY